MSYEYIKALHIIFIVTWFAGLFYIVRLFIYHREALDMPEEKRLVLIPQYEIMQRRLWYGITWPSAIVTLLFGGSMLSNWMPLSDHPWLIAKLCFLVGLYAYHFSCGYLYKRLKKTNFPYTSNQLRIYNEVATLFLFAIVFLVTVKDKMAWIYGILGIISLGIVLMIAIKLYRKLRESKTY